VTLTSVPVGLFGAAEARTAGYGGIIASSGATGLARSTIGRGLKDLDDPGSLEGKVRRPGSGRPALTSKDTTLLEDLHKCWSPRRWAIRCGRCGQIAKSSIPKLLARLVAISSTG
jgi:hypothetical protein